jgi:superfamily II RNA helicase
MAIQAFLGGASVVVCAPTGAGKTAIAEAAALAVLARRARARRAWLRTWGPPLNG